MELAISSSPQLPPLDASLPIYQRDLLGQLMKVKLPAPGAFDEYLSNAYRDYLGWHTRPEICALAPTGNRLKKILVINDLHAPFQHEEALHWVIAEHAHDTDEVVVAGDLADGWSFSKWSKLRKVSSPLHDYRETQKVLLLLAKHFRQVKVMKGNHCTRQHRYFAELLPPEVIEYLELTAPAALHPLETMVEELPNLEMIEPKRTGYAEFEFLYEVGDAVISHAEIYSRIPNKAVGNLVQWLMSYAVPAGIINPNFRVALQAHTHQAGKVHDNFGKVSFELGCLCHTQEYQGSAKLGGVRPSIKGCTVLHQDENGRTDVNRSHFYRYEEEREAVLCPSY